ncbi:MAG: metallophosphoesterase [Myxococcota bacterium]
MLRIAVIADSHFHPAGRPTQAAYPSDAEFNARNAAAVARVRAAAPDLVIHLGDVVHPIPGLPEHERALGVARQTYAELGVELLVVPGNHDVGDKLHPWAPAPSVSDAKHAVFRRWWGEPWWKVEFRGLTLVGLDSPLFNSGLPLEQAQWDWLDTALVPGRRTFVFLHYPLFLLTPDEPEHYDNIAEPARTRLLERFAHAGVEAVFAGHVHHPFWNLHRGTDYYLLPSTAFVRPEYSELGRVGPGDEHGRNEVQRLGFGVLHVDPEGHELEWIRTGGATTVEPGVGPAAPPRCPLGLTLRHAWDAVLDLPADGLDPFRRKRARNDLVLLAVLELGVRLLRLPFDDLRCATTRERLQRLARRGVQVVLFTADVLQDEDVELVQSESRWVRAVEWIRPRAALDAPLPRLAVPSWVAPYGRHSSESGAYFSHFAPLGFLPDDPDLSRVRADGAVFRLEETAEPNAVLERIAARTPGLEAAVLALTPRAGEGVAFVDDAALSARVVDLARAAAAHPALPVLLDTTVDHDRGYFPRIGLVDRAGNPRPAFWALRASS